MKPRTRSIIYWTVTGIFAFGAFFGGITELMQDPQAQEGIRMLGYPLYFLYILGTAKVLGALALMYTRWPTLTEWAYAGFTFDIIAASLSLAFAGQSVGMALFPLVFLVILSISYAFWKQR
jgi:uncharacterized membrane protein